jgi:uncharacterized protein (TIGR02646 family)
LHNSRAENARTNLRDILGTRSKKLLAQTRIQFDSRVWIDAKPGLWRLFYGKCAYCETALASPKESDVEHFRPKQLEGTGGTEQEHLYYGWLAYDWDNLLIVCKFCNQHKDEHFPVTGSRAYLLSSVSKCRNQEVDTLLDPCHDQPAEHISFDAQGLCVALSSRGVLTIDRLALNRPFLVESRARAIEKAVAWLRRSLGPEAILRRMPHQAHMHITSITRDDAPYAGAVRAFFIAEISRHLRMRSLPKETRQDLLNLTSEFASQGWWPSRKAVGSMQRPAKPLPPVSKPIARRRNLPKYAEAWLSRVEITNFKAIEQLEFDLPRPPEEASGHGPALVVLGENAAGKSSVLEAIALALLGTEHIAGLGLDGLKFIRRDVGWQSVGHPAQVRLFFESAEKAAVTLNIDSKTGTFKGPKKPQVVLLGYGPRRYFGRDVPRRSSHPHARLTTLFDATATLPSPALWLLRCSKSDFDAAIRALRQVLLLPEDTIVERRRGSKGEPGRVTVMIHGIATPLDRLSDGYRTIVTTVVDIIREMLEYWPNLEHAKGVVLVDELDTHLHPRWKMRILQRLRTALPNVQFVTTTHDPLCLRGAFDGEVQVLVRGEADQIQRLEDLPNVQSLSVEQLLTSDFFSLFSTEDPAVERELAQYAELAAKVVRSADEEVELTRLRESSNRRTKLGRLPREQLLLESAAEYVRKQERALPNDREVLREDARKELAKVWAEIVTEIQPT